MVPTHSRFKFESNLGGQCAVFQGDWVTIIVPFHFIFVVRPSILTHSKTHSLYPLPPPTPPPSPRSHVPSREAEFATILLHYG